MSRVLIPGLSGSNPLGFLGALGLLRLASRETPGARLAFESGVAFPPFLEGVNADLPDLVASDAAASNGKQPWRLSYEKAEKKGVKKVADLKAPPEAFARFLSAAVEHWRSGDAEAAAYAASFGTSLARDGKGNTKPTAFHFTAANQQFLGTVEATRSSVTREWVEESLFRGPALRPGQNLRWDPAADRNWALMASDPVDAGTNVDAPLEWLAFRALPLFPTFPWGAGYEGRGTIVTTAVHGRGDGMRFVWPLWSTPASLATARSLLQLRWDVPPRERHARGVFAVCASAIRRSGQGFGNFGPASVS